MKKRISSLGVILISFLFLLSGSSCSTNKNQLTYFKDITGVEDGSIALNPRKLVIQPSDELRISVTSSEPEATAIYNLPLFNQIRDDKTVSAQPVQETYVVDSNGDITMPVLGKIHVAGLTEQQLADRLVGMLSRDVVDPYVVVRTVNFKINVLGEVKTPGAVEKPASKETFTVMEALALAGDINEYSDRSNVMVLREENGKMVYHRLNLNESSSIASPYFYLQQDDVVIVPPSKVRQSNAAYDTNNSFKVQVVSTIVSAISVIASLVIALAVK